MTKGGKTVQSRSDPAMLLLLGVRVAAALVDLCVARTLRQAYCHASQVALGGSMQTRVQYL